ncbi:MAG: hypothetical protein ABIK09_19295 [Pseudomonadota bacterium]
MRPIRILIVLALTLTVGCMPKKDEPAPAPTDPNRELDHRPETRPSATETPLPDASPATPDVVTPAPDIVHRPLSIVPPHPDCTPDCLLKACGSDGCGGACGACDEGKTCRTGRCAVQGCVPGCAEKTCGSDGCGGGCGRCAAPDLCVAGACRPRIGVGLFDERSGTPGDGIPRAVENLYLGFPAPWSGPCDYGRFPRDQADRILARNPAGAVLLTLLPECGFAAFATDFAPGSKAHAAVKQLAEDLAALDATVIVRIAPQMNAPWFPWGPCALDNKDQPCLDDATKYREGFANVAALLRAHGGPRVRIAWTPLAEPAYWRESFPEYPSYADFYPGDDAVDYVGVDLSWSGDGLPPEGAFAAGLEPFYRTWSAPEGHGKPMIVAETTAECRLVEETACVSPVTGFEGVDGWWGPWGRLRLDEAESPAPEDCEEIPNGLQHLVLATTPDAAGSTRCGGYYLGGLALPLDWGEGVDLSGGNAFRLRARKDPSGAAPSLQIEVCDTTAPACPGEDRCCPEESVTTTITVDSLEWRTWTIPFEDFLPSVPGTAPAMDWARVRSLKLHVVCPDLRGPLAPLHLDGVGVSRVTRAGDAECDALHRAWARQAYAPELCARFPNLTLVLWRQGLRRTPEAVFDGRILDPKFWRELWDGECFTGTWF